LQRGAAAATAICRGGHDLAGNRRAAAGAGGSGVNLKELPMTAVRSSFLRTVIGLDAAACGVSGAALAFGSGWLAGPLGLSPALMQPVGLFLLGYAALLAWLATRPALPRAAVWALVGFNVVWAVESFALVALGWAQPTSVGLGVVVAQAAAALVVADLQYLALRKARREAAA
jgi:hypothetical protein